MFFVKVWVFYIGSIVVSTEILSALNMLSRLPVILVQIIVLMCIIFELVKSKPYLNIKIESGLRLWIGLISLLILSPLMVVALYYPPNNWDSMTYHLPRILHWIQNKNVEFYPTNNLRQLFMGVGSEYVILHWRIVFGSDVFSNFVQYLSMLVSLVSAVLVVSEFRGSEKSKIIALVLTATIPMGILQSTSTQTDYVTAFCLIAFILFGLKKDLLFWTLSLAIGISVKTTFLIFVLPFVIYFGYQFWQDKIFRKWWNILLITCLVFLINGPQWIRNQKYFGSILGPKVGSDLIKNSNYLPKFVLSNLIRNLAMNFGLPNTNFNLQVDMLVEKTHNLIGVSTSDPVNSFLNNKYKTSFVIHEDIAGNLLVVLLFGLSFGRVVVVKKWPIKIYYFSVVLGWVLFSIIFKWQLSGTRLQLPLVLISVPIVAILLKNMSNYFLLAIVGMALVFVSGNMIINWNGWLTLSGSNRQIGRNMLMFPYKRDRLYYNSLPELYEVHSQIANTLEKNNIKHVGLDIGGDSWEYPLWLQIKKRIPDARIEYIRNNPRFIYDAVIFDELTTENIVPKEKVGEIKNFGLAKLMILKVQ